jgi:hypothetical protein
VRLVAEIGARVTDRLERLDVARRPARRQSAVPRANHHNNAVTVYCSRDNRSQCSREYRLDTRHYKRATRHRAHAPRVVSRTVRTATRRARRHTRTVLTMTCTCQHTHARTHARTRTSLQSAHISLPSVRRISFASACVIFVCKTHSITSHQHTRARARTHVQDRRRPSRHRDRRCAPSTVSLKPTPAVYACSRNTRITRVHTSSSWPSRVSNSTSSLLLPPEQQTVSTVIMRKCNDVSHRLA